MHAYMASRHFGKDTSGHNIASPYDVFLRKNRLAQTPDRGETALSYARRLRAQVEKLKEPLWVTPKDGELRLHYQPFQFGETELTGMKIFLSETGGSRHEHTGNCFEC